MTGHELKEARKTLGMTQAQLAEALDVSPNTIARYEQPKGGYPIPKWVGIVLDLWVNTK